MQRVGRNLQRAAADKEGMNLPHTLFAAMALTFFATTSTGCSSDPVEDYCSRLEEQDCVLANGGSCRGEASKSYAEAQEHQCGGEYADYLGCISDVIESTKSCTVANDDDVCSEPFAKYVGCRVANP